MDYEKLYTEAKREDLMSMHSIEKYAFSSLLTGMSIKLLQKSDSKSQLQLKKLQRMERFLERITYFNVMYSFQTKIILELERNIAILEDENERLLKENISLKESL